MRKNSGLMKNKTLFLPLVYECLNLMHLSANKNIFQLMSVTALKEWRGLGESDFADYFNQVCLYKAILLTYINQNFYRRI